MKKIFYSLAVLSLVVFGFSCQKPSNVNRTDTIDQTGDNTGDNTGDQTGDQTGDNTTPEPEGPKVETAAENLVLHISFDNDNLIEVGEGVTFKENKGDAAIKTGFIGKGWTNSAKNNTAAAYTKFDVAQDNVFKKLESVTFTAWVKTQPEKSVIKGGLYSLNGARNGDAPGDWPAMCVYFDNFGDYTDPETSITTPWQQINGRFTMHDDKGNEENLWLNTSYNGFTYGEWLHFVVVYDKNLGGFQNQETGEPLDVQAALYINGDCFASLSLPSKPNFNSLVTDYTNAFYVGGWSSFIEGDSTMNWQNYWAGSIDEIRMYNKALSADEIAALYKEELDINLNQE